MKTILSRLKTLVKDNNSPGQTLSYVKFIEIIHPEIALLEISLSVMPSIFLAPGATVETWETTQRKKAEHRIMAYLVMRYNQRELNIIGDSTRPQGQGILDFENDFMTVVRGHRLAVDGNLYLDKPLDIEDIDRAPMELADGFIITSKMTLYCTRLFTQSSLPGNI